MLNYTRPNGSQGVIRTNMWQLFNARVENNPSPRWLTLAQENGVPHGRMEEARRSPEWRSAAERYLDLNDMDLGNANLKLLGVPRAMLQVTTSEQAIVERVTAQTLTSKFGVEIEFLSPVPKATLARAFNEAGIRCKAEGYNHQRRTYWKIVGDASVRGSINGRQAYGLEAVSPPMTGADAYQDIERVCSLLREQGCRVNAKCGLHVHVESDMLSTRELRNVCTAWVRHEQIVERFIPQSRRGNSQYCSSINTYTSYYRNNPTHGDLIANLNNIGSQSGLLNAMTPNGRYMKLNLEALARHGTLEFRHHSGTLNATKIQNHVRFCIGFIKHYMSVHTTEMAPANQTHDGYFDCVASMLSDIASQQPADTRESWVAYYNQRMNALAA